MGKRRYRPEEIINKLREVEILVSKGATVGEACKKIEVTEIGITGANHLAKIFSAIYIGDWVSYYLAILNGERPTPVDAIDYLKSELARFGDA